MNIQKRIKLHKKWLDGEPDGVRLEEHEADLREAGLDYSCLPLWCGSLGIKVDKRIWVQLAYHLCSLKVDDPYCIKCRNILLPLANQFHRVKECGELGEVQEETT